MYVISLPQPGHTKLGAVIDRPKPTNQQINAGKRSHWDNGTWSTPPKNIKATEKPANPNSQYEDIR